MMRDSAKLLLIFSYKSYSSWELEDLGLGLCEQLDHEQKLMEVSAKVCADINILNKWHTNLRKELYKCGGS